MQDTFNKIKPNCKILALMSDSRSIWGALAGFAKMTCCIWLFAAECLGSTAAILSRWDLESGGLFCVENRFFVWRDGIDAIPAIRFDCPLSQGGIAPIGRRLVPLSLFLIVGRALVDIRAG